MDIEILFGSRVRAETLATLATTSKPLSAYRVAKVVGAQAIQVLSVLKSLEPEIVRHNTDGWVMVNQPLRSFLRDAMARREEGLRAEKDGLLISIGMKSRSTHGPV